MNSILSHTLCILNHRSPNVITLPAYLYTVLKLLDNDDNNFQWAVEGWLQEL